MSLQRRREIPFQLFQFAPLLGRELIGAELDLDLLDAAGEFERHLRFIVVDHRRSGVLAYVETFIERKLADRGSLLDSIFGQLLAINGQGSTSAMMRNDLL
jgi:hypothetical protein